MTRMLSTVSMTGSVPAVRIASANRQPMNVFVRAVTMLSVWRERQCLATLDDRALRDVGLSQADVERETARTLFDVPSNRI